jgi:hypothetical protein
MLLAKFPALFPFSLVVAYFAETDSQQSKGRAKARGRSTQSCMTGPRAMDVVVNVDVVTGNTPGQSLWNANANARCAGGQRRSRLQAMQS